MKQIFSLLFISALVFSAKAQTTVTIGAGTAVASGTTNYQGPIYRSSATSSMNFARHRILYRQTDLAAVGIFPGVDITQIGWDKVNNGTLAPGRSATFRIYMKSSNNTSINSESWDAAINGATTVLSSDSFTNISPVPGFWMIDFNYPFIYTGGSIEIFTDWSINPGFDIATTNDFQLKCTIISGYKTSSGTASDSPLNGSAILSTTAAGAGNRFPNTKFTFVPSSTPLPVTISKFSGEKSGLFNKLTWTTQTEQNNKGFEIQQSVDGVNFSSLMFVSSKAINGNSSAINNYEAFDLKPVSGNCYYRLKQIDNDGKSTISPIVLIKGGKISRMEIAGVYPNPTVNKLNVMINSPFTENVELMIVDISGKIMQKKIKQINSGDNNFEVNVSALAPGSYFLKAGGTNSNEVVKFMKY